jgi:cation transporter-like permease
MVRLLPLSQSTATQLPWMLLCPVSLTVPSVPAPQVAGVEVTEAAEHDPIAGLVRVASVHLPFLSIAVRLAAWYSASVIASSCSLV